MADGDSSDDAWTPEEEEEEVESSVSGKSPSFSNGRDSYDSIDGCTEFNISYHKASQMNERDISSGVLRVAAPNVGCYTVAVDEMVGASGRAKETGPSSSVAFEDKNGGHQKYYPSEPFVTVSEIGLKTHPTGIPPPSRPPPVLKSDFKRSGSNSRTTGSEGSTEGGSPRFFDVEVDASSAAVRDAMVKAEAKLKSAKELFERKSSHAATRKPPRDEHGSKPLSSQGSVNSDGNEEWEEATQFVELVRTEQPRNADENSGGEDAPFPLSAGFFDKEKQQRIRAKGGKELPKHPRTRKVGSGHKRREDRLAAEKAPEETKNEKLRDVELQFEIGNNLSDRGGIVKHRNLLRPEEKLAKKDQQSDRRPDRKAAGKNQDCVFDWEQNARKLREALGLSDNESTLEVSVGTRGEMDESETKLEEALRRMEEETNSKEARVKEETVKKEKEAFEKAENEKRLRAALEQEEKVKKLKEENERRAAEAAREKAEEERKRKEQEEYERRLKEAFEKEEEERRKREAREKAEEERRRKEQEEYERRLKEAFEKEEKNRRMREAREKEENERKMKEAREKEENERRRIKEAHEKAEVERRMKETLEQEEKERQIKEREAYERRAREALEQAENERRAKEAIEQKEKERRLKEENEKKLKEAIELEEKEKRLIEAFERAETERRLKEELEQEEMRLQEAKERERTQRENQERQEKERHEEQGDTCEMEKTCETTNEANGEQWSKENLSDSAEEDERVDNLEPVNKVPVEEEGPSQRVSVSEEEACPWKVFEKNLKDASQKEGTDELDDESGKLNGESSEESASATDNVQEGKLKQTSKTVEERSEDEKVKNASVGGDQRSQEESKSTNKTSSGIRNHEDAKSERPLPSRVFMQQREKEAERLKRELDSKMEHLRKIEEEREREREREKDRMAFDQRALADARERLEKACAEARERSFPDNKASTEARLRAERAAVERATAEARERAAEKAAFEARDRMERSVSDKQFQSSGLFGERMERSVSEKQFQNSASFGASRYQNSPGADGESPQRYTSRLERHRRTADRVAKALAEKNMRDLVAQREQAERVRIAETLDAEVKRWSSGKEGNIRALLSTLQYILGSESGWQPLPLTEVITSAAVKRAYRKATLCVHPDKLQQRGANIHQKYICEKVFDLLKEAWNRFNSEER